MKRYVFAVLMIPTLLWAGHGKDKLHGPPGNRDSSSKPTDSALVAELVDATEAFYDGRPRSGNEKARLHSVAAKLRKDARLARSQVFELAALSDHMDREDRLAAKRSDGSAIPSWDELESSLIQEFPDVPFGYEGLMSAGENAGDRGLSDSVAQEILSYDLAPAWVKDRAQALLARNDLVGLSLGILLREVWPEGSLAAAGKRPAVLYVWSIEDLERMDPLMDYLESLPPDTLALGVCLSENEGQAAEMAKALGLRGLQFFSPEGAESACAKRIVANGTLLVYSVNEYGLIDEVSFLNSKQRNNK